MCFGLTNKKTFFRRAWLVDILRLLRNKLLSTVNLLTQSALAKSFAFAYRAITACIKFWVVFDVFLLVIECQASLMKKWPTMNLTDNAKNLNINKKNEENAEKKKILRCNKKCQWMFNFLKVVWYNAKKGWRNFVSPTFYILKRDLL